MTIQKRPDGTLVRVPGHPFAAGTLRQQNATYADSLLGPMPRSLDSVLAGLHRLRHLYEQDNDAETRQSVGIHQNRVTDARLRQLRSLIAWLEPAVRDEKAGYDAIDADLDRAKESRWPG